ncbi:hypothetical protein FRC00_002957, partial [Tulasnella sp. 408]
MDKRHAQQAGFELRRGTPGAPLLPQEAVTLTSVTGSASTDPVVAVTAAAVASGIVTTADPAVVDTANAEE